MASSVGIPNEVLHDAAYVQVSGVHGDKVCPGDESGVVPFVVDGGFDREVESREPRYRPLNELPSMSGRYLFAYCSPMGMPGVTAKYGSV